MTVTDALGNLCTHRVRLHFRSIGIPMIPEFEALRHAQRVYGPHGIAIQYGSGVSMALSQRQQVTLYEVKGECGWDLHDDEQRLLHSLGRNALVGADGIVVYYVEALREPDGRMLGGCAGHGWGRAAVAVSAIGSRWTLGHEVGHVLLGRKFRPVHLKDPTNLMNTDTKKITADPPELNYEQVQAIKASPYCVAC